MHPEIERRDKEIQAIELNPQELQVAHSNGEYLAKLYKWQLIQNGDNASMQAKNTDDKINILK